MFRLIFCTLLLIAVGCSAKPIAPTLGIYTFEENNYPCADVEFPDQIRLKDFTIEQKDNNTALVYDVEMPGYKVQVVKLYGDEGWSLDPLSTLQSEASKLYEINNDDVAADKSAVMTIETIDDNLYLKGSIAEFFQSNRAIRVDIYRLIKRIGTFKRGSIEDWKNSTTGVRTIKNMQNIVDYVYENMGSSECKYKEAINMDWWNK